MIVNWEIATVDRVLENAGVNESAMELINAGKLKHYEVNDKLFVWSNDLVDFLKARGLYS